MHQPVGDDSERQLLRGDRLARLDHHDLDLERHARTDRQQGPVARASGRGEPEPRRHPYWPHPTDRGRCDLERTRTRHIRLAERPYSRAHGLRRSVEAVRARACAS